MRGRKDIADTVYDKHPWETTRPARAPSRFFGSGRRVSTSRISCSFAAHDLLQKVGRIQQYLMHIGTTGRNVVIGHRFPPWSSVFRTNHHGGRWPLSSKSGRATYRRFWT